MCGLSQIIASWLGGLYWNEWYDLVEVYIDISIGKSSFFIIECEIYCARSEAVSCLMFIIIHNVQICFTRMNLIKISSFWNTWRIYDILNLLNLKSATKPQA